MKRDFLIKNSLSEKTLYAMAVLLAVITVFLSLIFSPQKGILVFLLVFLLVYWQRERLQDFLQKIKNPKASWLIFILTGWLWAILLELSIGHLPFNTKPTINLILGVGFYLPYFAIWQLLIKRYRFTFLEIFYLSGFGGIIFDLLITRKLLIAASVTNYLLSTLLVFFSQAVATLVLFGTLTILPALYLKVQESKHHNKPLRLYLVGLTPVFLAALVFIVWTIILKAIFTP